MAISSRQRYEILHTETGATLGRHRTRQAAIDNWRLGHSGVPVKIVRRSDLRGDDGVLIVEGTWHEPQRGR